MTVTTETVLADFVGNGATTSFPFTFPVYDEDHLIVMRQVIATGVIDLVYDTSAYSVTGIGSENGGAVVFTTAPAATHNVLILREVPLTQDLRITSQGGFHPPTVEEQLDLIVMQIQQLGYEVARSIRFGYGEDEAEPLVAAAGRRGQALTFDVLGNVALAPLVVQSLTAGGMFSTRALMAAQASPVNGQGAVVTEQKVGGLFAYNTSDLSALVTDDNRAGIYVAPLSDATGADGAWVRTNVGNVFQTSWFGLNFTGTNDGQVLTDMFRLRRTTHNGGVVELEHGKTYTVSDLGNQTVGGGHGVSSGWGVVQAGI